MRYGYTKRFGGARRPKSFNFFTEHLFTGLMPFIITHKDAVLRVFVGYMATLMLLLFLRRKYPLDVVKDLPLFLFCV